MHNIRGHQAVVYGLRCVDRGKNADDAEMLNVSEKKSISCNAYSCSDMYILNNFIRKSTKVLIHVFFLLLQLFIAFPFMALTQAATADRMWWNPRCEWQYCRVAPAFRV